MKIGQVTIMLNNSGRHYYWLPESGYTVRQLRAMNNDNLVKLVETQPRNSYGTMVCDVIKER